MLNKYVVNTSSLLSLLFYANGDLSFCSDYQINVFDECRCFSYTVVIPSHCFIEVLDKIRLGRLNGGQATLTSGKAISGLRILLDEYACELEVFDTRYLDFLFLEKCMDAIPLSYHLIEKLIDYHKAETA